MSYVGQRPTPCHCGGYWFPHRRGSGACEHSLTRDLHLAVRYNDNEALLEAQIEQSLKHQAPAYDGPCPF